jgi:ribonuclease E
MEKMKLPEGVGYIVRTVAEGRNKKELSKDLNRLVRLWNTIKRSAKKAPSLSLLHKEQDIIMRSLRDYYNSEVTEILVDDKETFNKIKEYMKIISPRDTRRVRLYKEKIPIFDFYHVEEQIESIYSNRVILKSGGTIVIDTTEALISIDVNSARTKGGKDIESMVFNTNKEAAVEIARQLRLRDLGGLIVIDFIDMRERKNIRKIEKILREELKKDRAKTDTSSISKFGLMELSRQRLRPSLESKTYQLCTYCQGRGMIKAVESASVSLMRRIWVGVSKGDVHQVNGFFPPEVTHYIQNRKRKELTELEDRYGVSINLDIDHALPPGEWKIDFVKEKSTVSQTSVLEAN